MIERVSSNQYSSQQRVASLSEVNIRIREQDDTLLPEGFSEKIEENVAFPRKKVEEIVDSLNKFIQPSTTALKFEFHEKLNEYYVKIIDDRTKEVVREIPPKKLLDFYAAMTEFLGLMVDKKI